MLTERQRYAGLPPDLLRPIKVAIQSLARGRLDESERILTGILARAPTHAEVLYQFALLHQRRNDHRQAIRILLDAVSARPNDAFIHNALASSYEATGDAAAARHALRQACDLAPEWSPCWFNYGWRLFVDNDIDQALPVLQRAVKLNPNDLQARTLLADVLLANGKSDLAVAEYRRIVSNNPTAAQAWWSLAIVKPMPLTDRDIATMRKTLHKPGLAEAFRVTIESALALALEAQNDYDGAFKTMQSAHALAKRSEPYDADVFFARVDAVLQAFPASLNGSDSTQGREVIFIVGMPRSGTTLTEQILAAHSQLSGGAELPDLGQVITDESKRLGTPFPDWVASCDPQRWLGLGKKYLDSTARRRRQHRRFTDKMPINWLYGGAIFAMLPQAKIVVCRRDPLETCLGCYRYMFRRHPYTHDFDSLARRWRDFDRCVRHWKQLYRHQVFDFVYEDLQQDPEARIRELLAFCELPFEQACVDFHLSGRRVATPSAVQVREPIRRDTARVHKYGALLDPLRAALGLPPFQAP